ncbi:MAG TPA: dienelactone hydrolase family protein [Kofleriaceae bacterium]
MTNQVTFPAASGEATGVLFTPDGGERRPGVVLIHEWWGVNDQIQSIAQKWAAEGFVVIVPDLFHGLVVPIHDIPAAEAAMNKLDFARALQEITGAVAYLKAHPRCTGKVAVSGYCMGGALSFATATTVPGLSAVVPFYGIPPGADWSRVDAPIQAHFAIEDDWATVDGGKAIQDALAKHKRAMELHVYAAKHAFCNDQRPEVYNPAACAQAWQRAVQFVRDHSA